MKVTHFDTIDVRFDASSMVKQVDGTWLVDGEGAHVGPYTYHDDKGQPFIEHVPAITLFEQASLDSAGGGAVTIRHGPGMVTPDRYREESHGAWVSAWQAPGEKLGVRLRLSSSEAIAFVSDAISRGRSVELSPVYEVDVIEGQDDAEAAKYGQHHAVQMGRRYSAIAILGQDEARGGAGTALKLDSNSKAPQGCRTQVGGPRLDSAPREPLHSDTISRNIMKHAIIRSDGFKPRKITAMQLAALRGGQHADAIEKGTVTIAIEGEEPDEFVLPTSMIEMLLEGIGASSSAPAADPMAEEMGAEEQLEAQDAGADDEEKTDSKIAREVARQLDARDHINSRTATVNSDAARLLPPGYDYKVHWTQVSLDAIAKADPDAVTRARKLAADARSNPVAEGRLLELLSSYAAQASGSGGSRLTLGEPPPHADGLDNPLPPHARSKDA